MPRFVVLRHETPPGYPRPPHYDLMLEQEGGLWTWRWSRCRRPGAKPFLPSGCRTTDWTIWTMKAR